MPRVRFPLQEAALRAALTALQADRASEQRKQDVLDCVAVVTNTLQAANVRVETVVIYLLETMSEWPSSPLYQEELISHALEQYYR